MSRSGRDGKSPCKLWLRPKGSQALGHLITESPRAGFNFLFVQRQKPPVAHHATSVNYHAFYIIRLSRVNEIGIDIIERNLVERIAFDDRDIRALSVFYRANF